MNLYQLPEFLDEKITGYGKAVTEFMKGAIDRIRFKITRVTMGIYEQWTSGTFMMRLRIPGGIFRPDEARLLAGIVSTYPKVILHATTRQEIQIHNVSLEQSVLLAEKLRKAGLSGLGGGGNTVRNILAGYGQNPVSPDRLIDLQPWAATLTTWLLSFPGSLALPRKFKIGFAVGFADPICAQVQDLGFVLVRGPVGETGFAVFAGGGMGLSSSVGLRILDFLPGKDVFPFTRAAINLFDAHGNRKNRHKARFRFLRKTWGDETFKNRILDEFQRIRSGQESFPSPPECLSHEADPIEIFLPRGDLPAGLPAALTDLAEKYPEISFRLTPRQNLLILNASAGIREEIIRLPLLRDLSSGTSRFFGNAVTCAGASTCRLGLCLPRNLLSEIERQTLRDNLNLEHPADLSLCISGCPNACGRHPTADLGFYGTARKDGDAYYPAYVFTAGADFRGPDGAFGSERGWLPAEKIPDFMAELLRIIAEERSPSEAFPDYLARKGEDFLSSLIRKHRTPPERIAPAGGFLDWGSDRPFSPAERLEGECAAGLLDMVERDFGEAEKLVRSASFSAHQAESVFVLSARALLITKGLEPSSDIEAARMFRDHFVGIHISPESAEPVNLFIAGKPLTCAGTARFLESVRALYRSMDDTLHFPIIGAPPERQPPASVQANKLTKDFRGVPCPLNFVKTKLTLELLPPGSLLEIFLDDGEPIANVPGSLREEGHSILSQVREGKFWKLLIRKEDTHGH